MRDTSSSLIRWGTAGWWLIIEVLVWLIGCDIIIGGIKREPFAIFNGILDVDVFGSGGMAIVVIASGIPLGYFLYQIYQYLYWTGFLTRITKTTPAERDLAERFLTCDRFNGLADAKLQAILDMWKQQVMVTRRTRGKGTPRFKLWAKVLKKLDRDPDIVMGFRCNWVLLHCCWLWSLGTYDGGPGAGASTTGRGGERGVPGIARAVDEFEYLSQRYHGLGAIMIGHWAACVLLFAYDVWRFAVADSFSEWWVYFVVFLAAQLVFFAMLSRMVWVNRLHLQSNIVMMANSFICHFTCPNQSKCVNTKAAAVTATQSTAGSGPTGPTGP
jgi:hypothetical protein